MSELRNELFINPVSEDTPTSDLTGFCFMDYRIETHELKVGQAFNYGDHKTVIEAGAIANWAMVKHLYVPIPLTPDILLDNLGFTGHINLDMPSGYQKYYIKQAENGCSVMLYQRIDENGALHIFCNYSCVILEFVHQVQNFYLGNTLEKLTLEP